MGATDPRLLINALGDLQDQCSRWAIEARENLDAAEIFQRRHEEVVQQTERRSQIVSDEATDDRDRVQRAREDVERLLDQCEEARHSAADLLKASQEALQLAQRTLKRWEAELDKALKWLERALARLERAEAELHAAEWEFRDAQSDLEDAIRALRRCLNDDNRRSCWSEEAAVTAAQERLRYAKIRLESAIEEYHAAQEEVEQAQARVACCRQAVGYAQQAVQIGGDAVSRSEAALAAAERSLDDARAAMRMVGKAQENVESELYEAEQMVIAARHAARTAAEAERSRRKADSANQSAQRLLTGSRMELEHRMGQLVKLNRSEFLGASDSGKTGVSSPQSGRAKRDFKKGSRFENWAKDNIFHGKGRRLVLHPENNQHLDKLGDGVGLTKARYSDSYLGDDNFIYELKNGYENGGIDLKQAEEYSFMQDAGYIYERDPDGRSRQEPTSIKGVSYIFATRAGAKANRDVLEEFGFGIFYRDENHILRQLK